MKEEDEKLKAALELKKQIEKDLGLKKKESVTNHTPLSIRASSYNLDFTKLSTFSDLYDLSDFDVSDEKIAAMMESHDFKSKEDFILYLKEKYDVLVDSLKERNDERSMYNLFITLMSKGDVKRALETAIKLKSDHSASPLSYLALAHVLFFLEDERWEDAFKTYISMSKDKMASFIWEVFKGNDDVKFPRISSRKYLLDVGMLFVPKNPFPREILMERICARTYNPCGNAFCKLVSVKNGANVNEEITNSYCYMERYVKSLALYMKGEYSKALLALPKIKDPNFLYFEALCHYSLDEPDGFNAMIKEINKIDPHAFFYLSISSDVVKSFGLAEESSALLKVSPLKLGEDYYSSLRKLMFEVAKVRGYSPSRMNFGMKIRRYHVVRAFFGYRSCKGISVARSSNVS